MIVDIISAIGKGLDFCFKGLCYHDIIVAKSIKGVILDRDIIGFGIAGNFAHHLEQAGESADFVDIVVDEADAPKGIFPTYVPLSETFLERYPFSSDAIIAPKENNIQMEPEVGLLCDVVYADEAIAKLIPTHFMAYNDCSIRVEGAEKISHKKNWGANSKGVSQKHIMIDSFSLGGVMDGYSLTSFIKRDGELIQYGENSELLGYSYFYERLQKWMIEKLNSQKEQGPLEDLHRLIMIAKQPKKLLISIGATRYTEFGEKHYLKKGDILYVLLYPHNRYSHDAVRIMIEDEAYGEEISLLRQEVV